MKKEKKKEKKSKDNKRKKAKDELDGALRRPSGSSSSSGDSIYSRSDFEEDDSKMVSVVTDGGKEQPSMKKRPPENSNQAPLKAHKKEDTKDVEMGYSPDSHHLPPLNSHQVSSTPPFPPQRQHNHHSVQAPPASGPLFPVLAGKQRDQQDTESHSENRATSKQAGAGSSALPPLNLR